MPISLGDFKKGNFTTRVSHKDTQLNRIFEFLKSNKKAFRIDEISKKLKINESTVRHSLRRLRKRGYSIVHKAPYFAYQEK